MNIKIPRLIIAGTGSGCGKTTVSCALIKAFTDMGLDTGTFKCGPDYIDPMFHQNITGRKSTNLDSFFFDDETLVFLLAKNGEGRDINIIEGVMGYYDGILEKGLSLRASTWDISQKTHTPVILVVNAKGASESVIAVIHGFRTFIKDNYICGVIFNQCSASSYKLLELETLKHFKGSVIPLGFIPSVKECFLESRHLGLVTAAEVTDLQEKIEKLGNEAQKNIKLEEILKLAKDAPDLEVKDIDSIIAGKAGLKKNTTNTGITGESIIVKIAVARDAAFCFYYEDSMKLLEMLGAILIPFSPLNDPCLPEGIDGIYLGGGYPELYAKTLSHNKTMLESIRKALSEHIPCIAECGGFMYITESIGDFPMADVIKTTSYDTGKLSRFGYIKLNALRDNMLCGRGDTIKAHEFHYWDAADPGSSFEAEKPSGRRWECVFADDSIYAGYPHFHFYSNPDFAVNYINACRKKRQNI